MRQQQSSRFKRICVFCGSSQGKKMSYHDAAIDLAKELVSRGVDLVSGGGGVGLMGLVSRTVPAGGRRVIGVIPRRTLQMTTPEVCGRRGDSGGSEVVPVADMHQRKAEMARQSDAFVALPGGYGTLEELLEVITWAQLGIHRKPVGRAAERRRLLRVYDSLMGFIDQAVEEGFISPGGRGIVVQAPTAQHLMAKLEEYVPYYDRVASGLNWEATRAAVVGKDAAATGSPGISVSGI
ncbi:hypothetical protein PVAP13_9KG147800 [Panicum virgatum]|uniref:Cytokinin riboside 5'-monophosphate phosphoribohydrolase n=1 Tax=Panicum virgatum TaxID=38727 RepID=A0A8T0NPT9_PANVG|nr:hypothetical protein PVAP13_9KG147800 [Panicum virgatum]